MRKTPVTKTIVPAMPAAVGLVLFLAVTAMLAVRPARAQTPAPDKSAVQVLFETSCSNCHDLAVITGQRKSRDDWGVTLGNMMARGAPITEEQAYQILDYLAKTYPDKG